MLGLNNGKTTFGDGSPDLKTSGFDFGVSGSYLLTDNIGVGASLGYMSNSTSQTVQGGEYEESFSGFGYGIDVDYFFGCCVPRFYTYAGLGFNMFSGTETDTSPFGESETKIKGMDVGLHFGFMYFLCPSLAMNMQFGNLGLNSSTEGEGTSEVKTSNFGLNLSSETLSVGVSWFPGREGMNF